MVSLGAFTVLFSTLLLLRYKASSLKMEVETIKSTLNE